jgi:hypothetical protein
MHVHSRFEIFYGWAAAGAPQKINALMQACGQIVFF